MKRNFLDEKRTVMEYVERTKQVNTSKKRCKLMKKYCEIKEFTRCWNEEHDWIFTDEMVNDKFVWLVGSIMVWVVRYDGKLIATFPNTLGSDSVDAGEIVWSRKTIELTTDILWNERNIGDELQQNLDKSLMRRQIDEYFSSL